MHDIEIKDTIRLHYQELSKNQKKLAEYIIENFVKVPFLSVQEVSEDSGTSTATIVRFSQRIGFSGYSELRDAISLVLQESWTKSVFPSITSLTDDVVASVAKQDLKDIEDTFKHLSKEDFTRAVDYILDAHAVYTAGLGVSYLLAQILAYQLSQVGIDAKALHQGSASFLEQLLFFKPNDLLIAMSYPPYSKETIETAKITSEKNLRVIAITNSPASPITFYSTLNLVAKSENVLFTNSCAAISVLINAITTECAHSDRSRSEKRLTDVESIHKGLVETIP
ncbi:MurR/RpiR family transcriptional regulator [Candidatus Neomarinimicrobiota bacterium]